MTICKFRNSKFDLKDNFINNKKPECSQFSHVPDFGFGRNSAKIGLTMANDSTTIPTMECAPALFDHPFRVENITIIAITVKRTPNIINPRCNWNHISTDPSLFWGNALRKNRAMKSLKIYLFFHSKKTENVSK